MTQHRDVVVVGGGRAGLAAAGYHLRRRGLDFVILDAEATPGGSWQHMWDSLHLFSPTAYSSLPGRPGETYPEAGNVVDYLTDYEKRYNLPVLHGARAGAVRRDGAKLLVKADAGTRRARAVISATGTWTQPFLPAAPGRSIFAGRQLHTVNYRSPADFAGQHVIVVGGGNSGAQIAADLALDGSVHVTWVTRRPARFLPDSIDGRALFDLSTARRRALGAGCTDTGGVASLGDIVAVPPVRAARDAGLLEAKPMLSRLTASGGRWDDGIHTVRGRDHLVHRLPPGPVPPRSAEPARAYPPPTAPGS